MKIKPLPIFLICTVSILLMLGLLQKGNPSLDNGDCLSIDNFSSEGPSGILVSGYTVLCSAPAASIVTYVYLHTQEDPLDSKKLVFRFLQLDTADMPKIKWINKEKVLITATHVAKISKMEEKFRSITIEYDISSGR